MRKVLFIIAFMTNSLLFAQSGYSFWSDFAKHKYTNLECISYTLHHTIHFANGNESSRIASVFADSMDLYFNDSKDTTLLHVNADSIWLIEYAYANISYGPRDYSHTGMNMYYYLRDRYTWQLINYAPFYFHPGKTDLQFSEEEIKDTVIDNIPFSIITFSQQISWTYNNDTKKYDIPVIDYIWFYCNRNTYWVDKIIVANTPDGSGRREIFEFKDIKTSGIDNTDVSKYGIRDPKYSDYAKYNFTTEFAPSVIGSGSNDTLLSDEILYFPLVNVHNDTIRLADSKGWILLDFWIYGCAPCISFWNELHREKDSIGYRTLEHDGIQLFCINNEGGVTQKFIDYATRFHTQDIMYAARGFNKLNTRMTPSYYLFAPNHDLVYHGYTKNIIDTLLNAKEKYEQEVSIKKKKHNKGAVITFDYEEYDYGTIEEGGDGKCFFIVRNTGDSPLLIDHVSSSCGCTTADYPQEAIAPGNKGKIVVKYNTSELGTFRKTILVVSNAVNEKKTILRIKGCVVKKK